MRTTNWGRFFRIQAANQQFVVAGLEANRFMAQVSEEYLSSEPLFGEFAAEMGSPNFLVAIDGPAHRHMRKVMQRGYSKGGLAPHLEHFADLTQSGRPNGVSVRRFCEGSVTAARHRNSWAWRSPVTVLALILMPFVFISAPC
ncbi:MAG: hypothetical protein IPL78_35920 [Chloroflexi bacterium]|nr:hypothetical protein [Chloroflexota bacterium]